MEKILKLPNDALASVLKLYKNKPSNVHKLIICNHEIHNIHHKLSYCASTGTFLSKEPCINKT